MNPARLPHDYGSKLYRRQWRRVESNHGPRDYETLALTN